MRNEIIELTTPKDLPAANEACLPFLIYERFIAELFRRQRQTHKAAAEINMVSSYSAAHKGSILADGSDTPKEAETYRDLISRILRDFQSSSGHAHPKLAYVVADALDAADRGEKTLIFCSRIATLQRLRQMLDRIWETRILRKWQQVYPDAGEEDVFGTRRGDDEQRGRYSLLQSRFRSSQDALYIAIREPYLRTLEPLAEWTLSHLDAVTEQANELLRTLRVGKTPAAQIDYQLTKRCVEQAAAQQWVECVGRHQSHTGWCRATSQQDVLVTRLGPQER